MARTIEDIVNNLTCVSVERKVYTAEEVGEENAGCITYILSFEHDPEKTDRADLIGFNIELAPDHIREYEFEMWDGRTFAEHLNGMGH